MSKFTFNPFFGGYDAFAVSKEKYTREQAIEIAKQELGDPREDYVLAIGDCWVRHRAGINEDGEPQVGWWLEYADYGRNCPAWSFHLVRPGFHPVLEEGYEHIDIKREEQ